MKVFFLKQPPDEPLLRACIDEDLALRQRQTERLLRLLFVFLATSIVFAIVYDSVPGLRLLGFLCFVGGILAFGSTAVWWNEQRARLQRQIGRSWMRSLRNGTLHDGEI